MAATQGTRTRRKAGRGPAEGGSTGRGTATTRRTRRTGESAPARRGASAANGVGAQPDAIDLLESDHRAIEEQFARFEALAGGAHKRRRQAVERISAMLSIHAGVEEMVFYPTIRRTLEETSDDILEGLEEHHLVKITLSELGKMGPEEERFDAKVTVLMENVRHHMREEEGELFPAVRRRVPRELLVEMHDVLTAARVVAAQSPHPHAPDTPPANVALNAAMVPANIVGRAVRSVLGMK